MPSEIKLQPPQLHSPSAHDSGPKLERAHGKRYESIQSMMGSIDESVSRQQPDTHRFKNSLKHLKAIKLPSFSALKNKFEKQFNMDQKSFSLPGFDLIGSEKKGKMNVNDHAASTSGSHAQSPEIQDDGDDFLEKAFAAAQKNNAKHYKMEGDPFQRIPGERKPDRSLRQVQKMDVIPEGNEQQIIDKVNRKVHFLLPEMTPRSDGLEQAIPRQGQMPRASDSELINGRTQHFNELMAAKFGSDPDKFMVGVQNESVDHLRQKGSSSNKLAKGIKTLLGNAKAPTAHQTMVSFNEGRQDMLRQQIKSEMTTRPISNQDADSIDSGHARQTYKPNSLYRHLEAAAQEERQEQLDQALSALEQEDRQQQSQLPNVKISGHDRDRKNVYQDALKDNAPDHVARELADNYVQSVEERDAHNHESLQSELPSFFPRDMN